MTALLALGGLLCVVNFYLSFLRYPILRMMGTSKDDIRNVSGVPLFGSLFVAVSLFHFWQEPPLLASAIVLILIDTAGPHWFAAVMLRQQLLKRQKERQVQMDANNRSGPDNA